MRAQDSRTVVQAVLGAVSLPEVRLRAIVAQAGGNPFFLEELAWHAVERGGRDTPGVVPETVHAVLAARLDRLPPEEKQLLQTAAVVGTEVPVPLLQAIAELPEAVLHRGLAYLQAAEFLYETRLLPEQVYTFKHVLTHEVAYGSLLLERRRGLHARIVEALEALTHDRVAEVASGAKGPWLAFRGNDPAGRQDPDQVDRLAYHAVRGEVWDKAVTYCQRAGARAWDRAASREAVAAFEQALHALAHLPEYADAGVWAIDLRLAVTSPLNALGEYRRYLDLLGEGETLARALDDRARLGRVLTLIGMGCRLTGDLDSAMAAGRQALALAGELSDSALQRHASYFLGQTYYAIGDCDRAVELLRWNVEAADRESGTPRTDFRRIMSQVWLVCPLSRLGAFAEGRRHGEEALRLAMLAGQGIALIDAHGFLGTLYLAQGDLEPAIRVLEQGLALHRTPACYGVVGPTWLAPGDNWRAVIFLVRSKSPLVV
jgi:tetratricopeptide (TPR) repeat protein